MSAIVLALGLTGAGATPFIVQSASASSVAAYDPVEGCDVDVETCEETTPETTVTTTITAPTPEEEPETTVTKTVTATPTKTTKSPTPKKSTTPPPASTPASTPDNPQPLPSQSVEVPPVTSPTPSTPATEPSVEMPAIAPTETLPTPTPSESEVASSEEVPLELRAGTPEFDQRSLTQRLSIPALVLVLLALFAVLIFEGRLRRMAHAAAVRKAGPNAGQPNAAPMGGGYPAGPGYATAGFPAPGYPGGTAYAPIISFVPVQTYPTGAPQYVDPNHPYPPQAYVQEPPTAQAPPPEPVVLHPDDFDSYNHEPPVSRERDMFEPLVPAEPPPSDIPPGGATPYEDGSHDQPLGAASAAEPGDSEPWQQQPVSLFDPAPKPSYDQPSHDQPSYDPPPYVPADGDVTAVTPLPEPPPPLEPTKEMPDPKRRRFGRKK